MIQIQNNEFEILFPAEPALTAGSTVQEFQTKQYVPNLAMIRMQNQKKLLNI
jgi:hypothetical protein